MKTDKIKWLRFATGFSKQTEDDQLPGEKSNYSLLPRTSTSDDSSSSSSCTIAEYPDLKRSKSETVRNYAILLGKFSLVLLSALGILNLGKDAAYEIAHRKSVSCSCGGTTVANAISRGCVFTPLALGWLPPQCLDLELSNEFDTLGPLPGGEWPYWADLNGTTRLTREEMGLLADVGGVFYTTQEWHVMHCMYTWRKHYRSRYVNGVTVERRSNGIDHIHHCEGIVLDRAPLQKIWTMAGVELNADLG